MPPSSSSAQVTNTHSPKTFLDLPKEIRLEIYDWVFFSTTLEANREVGIPQASDPPLSGQMAQPDHDLEDEAEDEPSGPGRAGSMFLTPIMFERLNLVCRAMNADIGQTWHSKITYRFPCTVAFIDVLSQWSQNKLESVRHIHIVGTPVPLYAFDTPWCYTTHFVHNALPIFPGLKLDVLTVENIWLLPDGEEVEGWCLGATLGEVRGLLASSGWRELRYLSGTLGFLSRQTRDLEEFIAEINSERRENGYSYTISKPRPRLCRTTGSDAQGNQTEEDTVADKIEVAEWKTQHPDFVGPTEQEIQVWARRGTDQYVQRGEGRSDCVKSLLETLSWAAVRASGKYLVEDGTINPGGHL